MRAGLRAALVSALPSTLYALVHGRDLLETARAAGSIAVGADAPERRQLLAGGPVHLAMGAAVGAALGVLLPRRGAMLYGALAGLAIGALNLKVIGPAFPRIRELPLGPQLGDNVLFGAAVGASLESRPRALGAHRAPQRGTGARVSDAAGPPGRRGPPRRARRPRS